MNEEITDKTHQKPEINRWPEVFWSMLSEETRRFLTINTCKKTFKEMTEEIRAKKLKQI